MNQMHGQQPLFGGLRQPAEKPAGRTVTTMQVIITVKAAPNPSANHGETVCVAGLRVEADRREWVRLYPVNFRDLESSLRFRKYDLVELDAIPASNDPRRESWKPSIATLTVVRSLDTWNKRRPYLDETIEESMCRIFRAATTNATAPSLALVSAQDVSGIEFELHPGWSRAEQLKIDAYVNQMELFDSKSRTPLEAPRFKVFYKWRCHEKDCRGHRQQNLDWELGALQRHLVNQSDDEARASIRQRFLYQMWNPRKSLAFYVGNQAKRHQTFSVLGSYYPPR